MSLSIEATVLFIADLGDASLAYGARQPTLQKIVAIQKETQVHGEHLPDHVETLDDIVRYLYEQGYGIDRSA